LIHPNVAIKNHKYKSSLSEDSFEDDLSDLYGKDDDYSEGSVEGKNSQNGYRQLGLIGNFVSTHSYSDCEPFRTTDGMAYNNCMGINAKMAQQNIIALTAKNLELTKRLNRLSRRVNQIEKSYIGV